MLSLSFADSTTAGRINTDMLSEQQVMELFFTPDNHEDARDLLEGDEDDACSWTGIECDDDGRIFQIKWENTDNILHGSLNFSMFPHHTEYFGVEGQRLVGEIDVGHLSASLVFVGIHGTRITGTLDIEKLPRELIFFLISDNAICDIINVQNLPKSLQMLKVQERGIHKEVLVIEKLGRSCARLDFTNCDFKDIQFKDPADARRTEWPDDREC